MQGGSNPQFTPVPPIYPWYDRNPLDVSINWTLNGAIPHVNTLRASYTVPANRSAFLTGINGEMRRITPATGTGYHRMQYKIDPVAGGLRAFLQLTGRGEAEDDGVFLMLSPQMILVAGDTVTIYSTDTSPDGVVAYEASFVISEFDA